MFVVANILSLYFLTIFFNSIIGIDLGCLDLVKIILGLNLMNCFSIELVSCPYPEPKIRIGFFIFTFEYFRVSINASAEVLLCAPSTTIE